VPTAQPQHIHSGCTANMLISRHSCQAIVECSPMFPCNPSQRDAAIIRHASSPPNINPRHQQHITTTIITATTMSAPSSPERRADERAESPVILYRTPTALTLLRTAAINLVLPFINGLMLGFGELFAHELAFRWGWGTTRVCIPGRGREGWMGADEHRCFRPIDWSGDTRLLLGWRCENAETAQRRVSRAREDSRI
jgi:hypothetical protein